MSRARGLVALALVLATLLATMALSPATAGVGAVQPTTLTLTAVGADVPTRVPTADEDGDPGAVDVTVASDAPVDDATYTTAVDGITVDPATGAVPAVSPGAPTGIHLDLIGVDPGLHALTVTVSAPDAATVTTTFPFAWVPGGQVVSRHDSLAGHVYYTTGEDTGVTDGSCVDCTVIEDDLEWFIDRSHTNRVNAEEGRPSCRPHDCQPYTHDDASGLTQIGVRTLGRFDAHHAVVVGPEGTTHLHRLVPLTRHHLTAAWAERGDAVTPYDVQLRLTAQGVYHLRDRLTHTSPWRGVTGRYRIGDDRALHLLTLHPTTRAHRSWLRSMTLMAASTLDGHRLRSAGVWLSIFHGGLYPGTVQDARNGYLLKPIRR